VVRPDFTRIELRMVSCDTPAGTCPPTGRLSERLVSSTGSRRATTSRAWGWGRPDCHRSHAAPWRRWKLISQLGDQRREHGVVTHRAVHQYEGRPSPSTQTAIDPPSPDLTSHRSATPPILRSSHHKLPEAAAGTPSVAGRLTVTRAIARSDFFKALRGELLGHIRKHFGVGLGAEG
jgi:hypothetical protein